jgi:two-component system sensor kinase FixL
VRDLSLGIAGVRTPTRVRSAISPRLAGTVEPETDNGGLPAVDRETAIEVPRFYKYVFLSIFLLAEMTIAGWSLLYMSIEDLSYRWFLLNLAFSTPVIIALVLLTYYLISRTVLKTLEAKEALRQSEGFLQGITDVANDAIIIVDPAGVIGFCNPAGEEMFGYLDRKLLGKEVGVIFSAQQRDPVRECFISSNKEHTGPGNSGTMELTGLRRDGAEFPMEISTSTVELGGKLGTEVIIRDITERKLARETIEKQAEELRNLIEVAAHELRHPAAIFRGYSHLLLNERDALDSRDVSDALTGMDVAAARISRLVNDMFDVSCIERHKLDVKREEVHPDELIDKAVEEMRVKGCDRDFTRPALIEDLSLNADPERIQQVLLILLDNADKFSPAKTDVEIWQERNNGQVVFHVADRGPGIPEADGEDVFERFYQGEDVAHHSMPGMGLGLYIARTIVEAHGGWIKVEPRAGGGSDFCFGIPSETC